MLNAVILWLEALAALGGLLAAGFIAFLTFVLRALRSLPTADGIKAMTVINLVTAKPIAILLSGTALLSLAVALLWSFDLSWDRLEKPAAMMAIAGSIVLGLGAVLVTLERTRPLNNLLGTATDASGEMIWRIYRRDWVTWNYVRAAACAVAGALLLAAAGLHTLHLIERAMVRDFQPTPYWEGPLM